MIDIGAVRTIELPGRWCYRISSEMLDRSTVDLVAMLETRGVQAWLSRLPGDMPLSGHAEIAAQLECTWRATTYADDSNDLEGPRSAPWHHGEDVPDWADLLLLCVQVRPDAPHAISYVVSRETTPPAPPEGAV